MPCVMNKKFSLLACSLRLCFNVADAALQGVRHRGLAPPVCGNGQRQASEECDGQDDDACPDMCTAECTCPAALPLLAFSSNTVIRNTIPSTLFGTNIVYSWEKDDYWNGAIPPPASDSLFYTGSAFLRYPGGEVTSYYHWDNPVGRGWSDSWAPNFNISSYEPEEEWMSLDEYFNHLGDAKPLLGVNMASGWKYDMNQDGLDQAAAMAAYVKNKSDVGEWPVVEYWFLDNEQHLENFNGEPWSEELYATYINMYALVIKNYFPNARLVANWKNNASPGWSPLITEAGSNIQVMDIHSYWHRYGWGTTDWQSYLDGANDDIKSPSGSTYRDFVQSFKDVGGPTRETAMYEWGLSPSQDGSALSRLQSAFVVADIFMQLVDSDLDHACYWPFRVTQNSIHSHRALVDENNEPTVIRLFLQFFKEIKGYDLVQASVAAANTGTIAAKSKSGTKMVVYILRRSSGSLQIRIADSAGSFVPTTATAVSWSAPNEDTNNVTAVWSSPETRISVNKETTLIVSGWSLTRVILDSDLVCNNNGVCEQGEDSSNCPNDCLICNNNGDCEQGEDSGNCPNDCPCNDDDICDQGEDSSNCPNDCCQSDGAPCNHRGSCDPIAEICCSDCCKGISGGNPKSCLG